MRDKNQPSPRDEIGYTYMADENYVIFKPDGDVFDPAILCTHLDFLERELAKYKLLYENCEGAFEGLQESVKHINE